MHQVSSSAALIAVVSFTSALAAQVVAEIPAPTVATSFIDFDTMPLGPTGVGALNGAGVPAAASISTLTLTPSTAAPGVFNTNPGQQALALVAGAPEIIDGLGTAPFDAFNASIVFTGPCTEVGFGIGDWNGPMIIDFSLGGILQTSLTSSAYGAASLFKYYQMTGGAFDQIDIRASTTSGNWVIVDMEVQVLVGLFANFTATPTTGASPLAVQFTDLSFSSDPGGVLAWAWDFENDGTIDSMVQNPMHTYPTCGTFDVSLTVTDAAFPQSTALKTGFIVTDPVTASFTVAFLAPPGIYQFTDTSTPTPTAWAWDFDNDGTVDSTAQHPVFVSPGACLSTETSLTVTHSCSIDTVVESLFLAPSTLTGILAGGNGTASATQVGNLFDISVTNPQGINICGLTSTPYTSTGQRDIEVYLTEDTFVGKDADITQWRLVGTGSFVSTGGAFTAPTPHSYGLDAPIFVPNGNYGMAVFMADPVGTANVAYTNGPQGPFSNADLTLIVGATGVAKTALFGGSTFSPRIWNGEIHYTLCSSSFDPGYGFYGTGCAGTAGVPSLTLQAGSAPRVNTTLNVDIGNIPAAGVAIMTMGLSNTASIFGALPFDGTPFGAPGCFLRASPDVNTFLFGTPTATWSLALPNDPGLLCVQFFNQAFTLDTGANALGFVTSDAYSGIVGQ